jgi:hypothetical protein
MVSAKDIFVRSFPFLLYLHGDDLLLAADFDRDLHRAFFVAFYCLYLITDFVMCKGGETAPRGGVFTKSENLYLGSFEYNRP